MPPVLLTARLVLDAPNDGDTQAVFELCQDPEIQHWVPIASPFRLSDAEFFITSYVRHGELSNSYTTWALREGAGEPLEGTIELRRDMAPASASIGCWIGAPYRRRGLMKEALSAVTEHAFATDGLGLKRLRWQGLAGNAGSAALAGALGFTLDADAGTSFDFRGEQRAAWTATLRA
ncbi:GNAT family N-acetyltransferase [Leifsonia sp. Root112D2]|uniref:GNAT family N-acetyltransferase n=1 Tax=Leifsonia sp. Root112D2 TaxID=1736426 RepID=UPI0006F43171|nr:GNAT family N-acetyltransferase [Leifsonia sp. Root112D2]KQV08110.1 hypothetical protein ASC63_13270 [Leifsonia sp. Root112D2]